MAQLTPLSGLVLTVNGLSMGSGQTVRLKEVRGLDDLVDARTFDSPRPNDDGVDFGKDLLNARVVEVDGYATPTDPAATLTALRAALLNNPGTLVVAGLPGLPPLQLSGRVRRRKLPTDQDLAVGVLRPTFDFEAADPHLYAASETVLTTGPGTPSGSGIAPPFTPPITPGGSTTGGLVQATNAGILSTRPIIRVQGPVTAFSLLNATTQRTLTFSLALSGTDYVDIDVDARTVLLNGTASRRSSLSGAWWDLPPGLSNVYYLPADAAVGSLMTLRFRSAY